MTSAKTLGELKQTGYKPLSIREELRKNLILKMKNNEELFPGIFGYNDTVLKQLKLAILAKHDILLMGLRGQGKTRLLRNLVQFMDEYIPVIEGSPLNEDPLAPISPIGKKILAEQGDATPIFWLHRKDRFHEKLATPDVSMADLIGDIDPIKAVSQQLDFSQEDIIHYGIIPKTNRGIFLINELPDLQPRIQVGLLNILEERDVQIRGFSLKLDLDLLMCSSANPEDYTNRGNIITPLKDRIDSQIITHYPETRNTSKQISQQEIDISTEQKDIEIPHIVSEVLEQIAFEARRDQDFIDPKSGVSARLSITALELLYSQVERRTLTHGESSHEARISDIYEVLPALTGKIELVFEGEREGPQKVAHHLIAKSVKTLFNETFLPIKSSGQKAITEGPYAEIIQWFDEGNHVDLDTENNNMEYYKTITSIPSIESCVNQALRNPDDLKKGKESYMELLLEGLHQHGKIGKVLENEKIIFKDVFSSIL